MIDARGSQNIGIFLQELINGEDDVYVASGRWSGPQAVAKSEGHVSAGRGTNMWNLKSKDTE